MKPSPLQLRWVTYPSASYEIVEDFAGANDTPTPAKVDANIHYAIDGEHYAYLRISSDNSSLTAPYHFSVMAVAAFSFDLELANKEYRTPSPKALPPIIAVNVARILYSGAREHIAMMTARGTYGAAVLDSVMLEPSDVVIGSDVDPIIVLREVFKATEDDIKAVESVIAEGKKKAEREKKSSRA